LSASATSGTVAARRVAIVGGGWAGIAAAVSVVARATDHGHRVTLLEMAPQLGGRARSLKAEGTCLDNGQHILIGAYTETLSLMRTLGVDLESALCRLPLALRYPDGSGLALPGGPPLLSFLRGVLAFDGWHWRDRVALLFEAGRWTAMGFRCDPGWTVGHLCRGLTPPVRAQLIEPLCIAALNTAAAEASATVFLRVLRDALFSGRGSADLLLPRLGLDALLPLPAARWLAARGVEVRLGSRVGSMQRSGPGWQLDGAHYDAVVLACSAAEAARLTAGVAPAWSAQAAGLRYEPIITVYLRCAGARLPLPMMALRDGADAPAQFVFDLGALARDPDAAPAAVAATAHDAADGLFAFVVSGARAWVEAGLDATTEATLRQAQSAFPAGTWPTALTPARTLAEKRATFRCTPGLARPPAAVAPGLLAAGDYIAGPYPATLEGAVRSGRAAAAALG
jgi:squalene-associated FAD-dependent desaturase